MVVEFSNHLELVFRPYIQLTLALAFGLLYSVVCHDLAGAYGWLYILCRPDFCLFAFHISVPFHPHRVVKNYTFRLADFELLLQKIICRFRKYNNNISVVSYGIWFRSNNLYIEAYYRVRLPIGRDDMPNCGNTPNPRTLELHKEEPPKQAGKIHLPWVAQERYSKI